MTATTATATAAKPARKRQPKLPLTEAQRRLAEQHWGYALQSSRAWRSAFWRRGLRLPEELIQSAAATAVMDVARTFRAENGAAFRTLLNHRVRGAILDALRAHPFTGKDTRYIPSKGPHVHSLDTVLDGQDHPCTVLFAAPGGTAPDTRREDFEALIKFALPRGRAVLRLIYLEGLSQVEAARELGIHQSRVSQIVSEALEHLRNTAERSRAC